MRRIALLVCFFVAACSTGALGSAPENVNTDGGVDATQPDGSIQYDMTAMDFGDIDAEIPCEDAPTGVHYVDATRGDDSNDGANTCRAWQTVTKVNASALSPGDSILFRRGETFYGELIVSASGMNGIPITFGAYGHPALPRPVLSGFTRVASWTSAGTNLWRSTLPLSDAAPNMLVIDGVDTPKGRYPNTGYLPFSAHSGRNSITGALPDSPNWTGAELVMRQHRYMANIADITSQSGGTLTYTGSGNGDDPVDGFGYFIQDDIRTLDAANEWFYDTTNHTLVVYASSMPTDVRVATVENIVRLRSDYIVFDNLAFEGSSGDLLNFQDIESPLVRNCTLTFAGLSAIRSHHAAALVVENSDIDHVHRNGIEMPAMDGDCHIADNTIRNVGLDTGMIGRIETNYTMRGITLNALDPSHVVIERNTIDRVGYNGIEFQGYDVTIRNNFVTHFCNVLDDGGGIYSYVGDGIFDFNATTRVVDGNIVVDSEVPTAGAPPDYRAIVNGIYMDGGTHDITITNNTVANMPVGFGYFGNDNYRVTLHGNKFFNNSIYQFGLADVFPGPASTGIVMENNQFVARTEEQYAFATGDIESAALTSIFVSDNNYFARPIDDTKVMYWYNYAIDPPYETRFQTLAEWQATNPGLDVHSHGSPIPAASESDLRFEYNATSSPVTLDLGDEYVAIEGTSFTSLTLAPYTSEILIRR